MADYFTVAIVCGTNTEGGVAPLPLTEKNNQIQLFEELVEFVLGHFRNTQTSEFSDAGIHEENKSLNHIPNTGGFITNLIAYLSHI